MDEDYDELMGPRPGQDMGKVFKDDPSPLPQETIRRTSSSNSGPPPTLFHSMPDRWSQEEQQMNDAERRQATGRKDIMSFDEEEDESAPKDSLGIRQEALRMLEVAESGTYSVHRTVTGGFMAEPRSMGSNKRVPTALAGLGSFATGSARSSKPRVPSVYRDTPVEENYEYGDYDDSRFASQQVKEEKKESSSTWSSRYSVDDTLLAMSGGSVKSKKTSAFLDKLDSQNERRSARNMFAGSPAKDASIFGAGFNFRQKNVFGKQGATTSDSNLRTVWMDAGASNSPARSWMDDLKNKQNKRRNYMIIAALFCAFVITMVAVLGSRNRSGDAKSSVTKTGPNGEEAVTFYVTSDTPMNEDEDQALTGALTKISTTADFLVHLGSIQDPEVTQCAPEQYEKVADILFESPIPVFVLPGQEDWNNCPDQDAGWYNWVDNFMEYDTYFDYDYTIMRQQGYTENFAFIDRDVLFIGVHETDGRIDDIQELRERNAANVAWIDGIANTYGDSVRAMVIFANGRPYRPENNDFYLPLANVLAQFRPTPVAYIHANDDDGDDTVTYQPYEMDEMDHVVAIQSSRGGANPPLRIRVGWDEVNPFIVG